MTKRFSGHARKGNNIIAKGKMLKPFIKRGSPQITDERKNYLSGNANTASGRKQGVVFCFSEFDGDIYSQAQFTNHEEILILLPTELLEKLPFSYNARREVKKLDDGTIEVMHYYTKKGVEFLLTAKDIKVREKAWKDIVNRFTSSLGLAELYGNNHVAWYIHLRNNDSGPNLHLHLQYVDRYATSGENILYNQAQPPYAFNLATGTIVKNGAYNYTVTKGKKVKKNKPAPHHFKVYSDTPKLDFDLVDKKLMIEMKELSGNKNNEHTIEVLQRIGELKEEIVRQAQSKSTGVVKYSKRIEKFEGIKDTDGIKISAASQQYKNEILIPRRAIITVTLNQIVDEYKLVKTVQTYGIYTENTFEDDINQKTKALEVREENAVLRNAAQDMRDKDFENKQLAHQNNNIQIVVLDSFCNTSIANHENYEKTEIFF